MLNEKIRIAMLKKGVNVAQLSEKTGISNSTLHYNLKSVDLFEKPRKIAKALGVELKDIVE